MKFEDHSRHNHAVVSLRKPQLVSTVALPEQVLGLSAEFIRHSFETSSPTTRSGFQLVKDAMKKFRNANTRIIRHCGPESFRDSTLATDSLQKMDYKRRPLHGRRPTSDEINQAYQLMLSDN